MLKEMKVYQNLSKNCVKTDISTADSSNVEFKREVKSSGLTKINKELSFILYIFIL